MRTIKQLIARRTERRRRHEETIEYAIDHARSESERNELIDLASAQGVFV
jgi:hypothetical protein